MATQTQTQSAVETEQATLAREADDGGHCRHCGAAHQEGALYCGECGHALMARQCPKCGAALTPSGDFCEACHTWLQDGQCRFCYAGLPDGSAYCPECGNPQSGIACPTCGTQNFFDFCSHCSTPLTESAQQALAEAAGDPLAQAAMRQMAELSAAQVELERLAPSALRDDHDGGDGGHAPPRRGLFSERGKQAMAKLREDMQHMEDETVREAVAQLARRNAEAARQEAEAQLRQGDELKRLAQAANHSQNNVLLKRAQAIADLRALIQRYSARHFANHQESRRFFMALQTQFPAVLAGWRCNCCSALHASPNACASPSQGGEWVVNEHALDAS